MVSLDPVYQSGAEKGSDIQETMLKENFDITLFVCSRNDTH